MKTAKEDTTIEATTVYTAEGLLQLVRYAQWAENESKRLPNIAVYAKIVKQTTKEISRYASKLIEQGNMGEDK